MRWTDYEVALPCRPMDLRATSIGFKSILAGTEGGLGPKSLRSWIKDLNRRYQKLLPYRKQ